jgi:hypothetical protein
MALFSPLQDIGTALKAGMKPLLPLPPRALNLSRCAARSLNQLQRLLSLARPRARLPPSFPPPALSHPNVVLVCKLDGEQLQRADPEN